MTSVVCIGECMLELAGSRIPGAAQLGFGGDAFNTALYLARLGLAPAFLTALGTDAYSEAMLAAWTGEGIRTELVMRDARRLPGLYAIRTAPNGEREFAYWRSESAARALFQSAGSATLLDRAADCGLLYLSGITLSLFSSATRRLLRELAARVRERGGRVAFDPNYRARGWAAVSEARDTIGDFAPLVSMVFPTLEDETALWGDASADAVARRWRAFGALEGVVKRGAEPALVFAPTGDVEVPAVPVPRIIDTTAAGDAFNAGYLARRLSGSAPAQAARFAHRLAGVVVQHGGAIAPREAMAELIRETL